MKLLWLDDWHTPGLQLSAGLLCLDRYSRCVAVGLGFIVKLHDGLLSANDENQTPRPDGCCRHGSPSRTV